jgi:glucokinase
MKNQDPLCIKVMDKFMHIFGVAVSNYVLKTLPYGGVYLIGGVVYGMHEYFIKEFRIFMDAFYNKGRHSDLMRQFPVFLVHSNVSVGILGAEELARRILLKKLS